MAIIRTRFDGDLALRSTWPDTSMPPPRIPTVGAGEPVTTSSAAGLPAVGRAVRLVAGIVAALELAVFEGRRGDRRERDDTWQAQLFASPALETSAFAWRYDIAASLEACENAFLLKVKTRSNEVVELRPIHPDRVRGYLDGNGEKRFDVWQPRGQAITLDSTQVLHVRGHTVAGGAFGVSRIGQHANALSAELARNRFEGSFFRNDARPGVALRFPANITAQQAREYAEQWDTVHAGAGNAHRTGVLGGGAELIQLPINLQDAQFVDGKRLGVEEVGRIMDVDPVLLGAEGDRSGALNHFLAVQLPPRLRRVELELRADPDLFGAGPLYPQFQSDPLLFADPLTRSTVVHQQIQDGTLLVDEARADMGRPPLPDGLGQIPQIVPVGGSPFGVPATTTD